MSQYETGCRGEAAFDISITYHVPRLFSQFVKGWFLVYMCSVTPPRWRQQHCVWEAKPSAQFTMSQPSSSSKAETGRDKQKSGVESRKAQLIHLQVGEKVFSTTRHTLCKESAYFRTLLRDQAQQLTGGTYFVDADPELFSHILRYLRHGIYPVSFSRCSGHDYATYLGVERLATEFGIQKLMKWFVDKQYESAM